MTGFPDIGWSGSSFVKSIMLRHVNRVGSQSRESTYKMMMEIKIFADGKDGLEIFLK